MQIKALKCPNCGYPLPESARPNELIKCPACNSTLFLSDAKIGDAQYQIVVPTPTRLYTVHDLLAKDDLCNVYRCAFPIDGKERQGMFRIARDPGDNDLVQNEARILYYFQSTGNYEEFRPFLPMVLESFLYQDGGTTVARQVNILNLHDQIGAPSELYSLEEVREHYPDGIDPKDMAWMWRRLLMILGYAHESRVVHGAPLPLHILIEPREHKLTLMNWGFAVHDPQNGNRLKALSVSYEHWYPPEATAKTPPTPALDLYMAARCMIYLIGGDPLGAAAAPGLDAVLQEYFARCLDSRPDQRPFDAWSLLDEFDHIIERLWGARTFRPFSMPYKA